MKNKSQFRSGRGAKRLGHEQSRPLQNVSPTRSHELASAFSRALEHHQAGQLADAKKIYEQILKVQPNHFDSLHLLGVIYHQRGNHAEAVRQIDVALKINSKHAFAYGNRGNALRELKRLDEALASYDRALALKPDYAEAFNNRGVALQELKRFDEALTSYDKALALNPSNAEAFFNRGIALKALKRFDEALTSYDRALALKPDSAGAFTNRGNVLKQLKRFDEAMTSYDRALALEPNIAEALSNRGVTLQELKRLDEALASYDRALAVEPDYAEALSNRGVTLQELKRLDEALASYEKALIVKPDYAEAHNNRGDVLKILKRYDEAIINFERALSINPDFEYAKGSLLYSKMQCCDWRSYAYEMESLKNDVQDGKRASAPFALICLSESGGDQLLCSEIWVQDKCPVSPTPIYKNERFHHDKIRIAYLSADFHRHATAYLTAELFERHDRSRFEIIGVSFGLDDKSEMRRRLVGAFDQFYDIREKSDEEIAKLLHHLQVDIAIDLKGYTQESRPGILAHRPAPIQVNYLGYPGTMGAEFIDYVIADKTVAPFEHQPFYTEKIVHLPDSYQVNDTRRKISDRTPSRSEAGLPETGFVFCCFNNNYKITAPVFDVWMRLLRSVEGSVLWLLRDNAAAEANLRKEALTRGIDPSRLIFAGRLPLDEHLARHRLADLFLDTMPVNAHTTASDALWAGLPVVTRLGEAFAGRVAASLLNAIGLPELVTHSIEDYEALALRLASDPELLEGYRNRLAMNRLTYPLFDTDRFRRHIEAGYLQMWEIWQRGEQPKSFAVEMEGTQQAARQELLNLPQMLKQAVALHQKGEFAEAEGLYLQILKASPDHFDAQHLLAGLCHQQGRNIEALEWIGAALKTNPNVSPVLSNYGTILTELNRYGEAIAAYDKALEIEPDNAETLYGRATTLNKLKRHEEALASYDKALAIKPQYVEALYNRGNALKDLDRYEEALASYDRALALRPNYAKALFNRGVTLQELRWHGEAIVAYDKAIALKPDYAEAFTNRGNALQELKRFDEALASYDRALALKPDYAEALFNRGNALKELSRFDEVLASYDRALALKPDYAEALNNRGNALVELKRLNEALASYDKAIAVKSDYADAFNNRGNALRELKRLDEALASYDRALALKPDHANAFSSVIYCINRLCDWRRTANVADDVIAHVSEKKSIISPFALLGYSGDPLLQLQCARNYVADRFPSRPPPLWTGSTWRHDKLRIAYLSADFRSHPVAYLMAELFEQHHRSRFEIIGISFGVDDGSEMRKRLVAAFDEFHDVRRKSDKEVAELLYDLHIDVAIDLMGYTQDSRPGIFAYRPAPIQVNYLGYPGTMGAEFIDYIIADKTVAPFEHQPFYTEKIVHLPDFFQVNDRKRKIAAHTPTREEAGLPAEGFVFCCFNNNWKITPAIFDVWMRLLSRVEGSVLWLSQANDAAVRNLRREADARGIDASRLIFAPRVLRLEDHLARHRLADLFLDTMPYNAHTTASDALWAGLPVVTRLGEAFAGRVAASLLNAIGLPELVTHSIEDYEALALRLASDPKLLEGYRNRLAMNRLTHPLFDTDRFRRRIEAGYLQMWEIWQRGEQPRSFAVEMECTQPPARQELPNLPQMLKRAAALHQKGEMAEAESLYLQILKAAPNHFDGLHLLGVLRHQQGRHTEALELIVAALKTNPNVQQALLNYGTVFDELKRYDEAIAAYDKALEIKPDDAETLYCRATTLNKLKRHEEALASYDKALAIRPQYMEALYNRGNVLKELDRYEEALASYDRALAVRPNYAKALFNRGVTLQGLRRHDEAIAAYDKAIALEPDYAEAFSNRGNALQELKRFEEALASYDKALALKPDYAEGFLNRGIALKELKRLDEALASYDKALALKPDYAEAFYNRGIALQEMKRLNEALASYDKALALKADYAEAEFGLCMAELPILYENESEIIVRRAAYERRLRALCDAGDRRTNLADLAKGVGSSQPFYLAYQAYNDRDLQALYGSFVCRVMAKRYPPAAPTPPPGTREPVRVGIVSGFFRQHSNWKLPIKGWLSQLDRRRFRIFGYHTGTEQDGETRKAAEFCERFIQGPLSIERWREAILADAPHVLIYPEVGMDHISAQLAAQRLAPVQCNSWGHPDTSGFPTLDYYLSSDLMEPPDGQDHYTERLVRLPNLSVYCEPVDPPSASIARQDLGLSSTAIVYWCGQSLYKYLPQFDEIFPRIARAVGDCQFAFIQYQRGAHITELFRQRLNRAFGKFGLKADDHCSFLPRLNQQEFVTASGLCDVFLDSINWSGCNSTLESLVHDLPIVTMTGPLMRGRHSMAILKMMGVTETIAETIDDYVSIAVRLARDLPWRMAVKAKISTSKHQIYFDRACISGLEQFLNHVVRQNAPTAPF